MSKREETRKLLMTVIAVFGALAAAADFKIELDLSRTPIKDVRTSPNGPMIGYAGCFMEPVFSRNQSGREKYWFGEIADETARAMKEAGAWHQRMWHADDWFAHRVPDTNPDVKKRYEQSYPDIAFKFWKTNGFKLLFTLEAWGGERSKKQCIEFVKKG